MQVRRSNQRTRRGSAAVELAAVLPVLCFIGVAATDYARLNYAAVTIANSAYNGAIHEACPRQGGEFAGYEDAALADAENLSPAPVVTKSEEGGSVKVTVSYTFKTLVNYPGIPRSVQLIRSASMVKPTENP